MQYQRLLMTLPIIYRRCTWFTVHVEDITHLGIPSMVEAAVVQSCNQWHVKDADLARELPKQWVTLGLGFTVGILQSKLSPSRDTSVYHSCPFYF